MYPPEREAVGPGQESVWDYPRPPKLEPVPARITIDFNGARIADTTSAYRVCETSHPPTYYLPPDSFLSGVLQRVSGESWCEWKGLAGYYDIVVNDKRADRAGWFYPDPFPDFRALKDHVAVYAHLMDACHVAGERVTPQPGNFYGGWITSTVVGPFKGAPGTLGW